MKEKTKVTIKIVLFSIWLTGFVLTQILLLLIVNEDLSVLIPVILCVIPDVFLIRGLIKNGRQFKTLSAELSAVPAYLHEGEIQIDKAPTIQSIETVPSEPEQNDIKTSYKTDIPQKITPAAVAQYAQETTYKATAFRDYFKTTVVEGLPIPTGTKCSLYLKSNCILCKSAGTEFSIPKERIISVVVDKSKNIQKQIVSSAGGALAGGLMLGAVGAAFGGRAKTKKVVSKKTFLSVVYKGKDGEVKNLLLEPMQNDVYRLKSATKSYNQNNIASNEKIEL